MNISKETVECVQDLTISEKPLKTDITPPHVPEHYDPDLLKLIDVYEKRIFQSNHGLDFGQIKNRIPACSELTLGISQLEKETDVEIQLVLDRFSRKETALKQRLEELDRELEKTRREREQQDQTRLDLEKKSSEVNRQYELNDTIDQELDGLALAVNQLAGSFQPVETTNHLKIHAFLFGNVIFSSTAHFGKDVNILNRLFLDANKQDWCLLFNKQMAKCQEEEEEQASCSEQMVKEFKGLLEKSGLSCSEKQEPYLRDCLKRANRLKRYAIVRYPDFPARARAHHEKRTKSRNENQKVGNQSSWVKKFKKLAEK